MDITKYDNDFKQLAYFYTRMVGGDAYDDEIEQAYEIMDRHGFTDEGEWIYDD
jgi:hypothetical protein